MMFRLSEKDKGDSVPPETHGLSHLWKTSYLHLHHIPHYPWQRQQPLILSLHIFVHLSCQSLLSRVASSWSAPAGALIMLPLFLLVREGPTCVTFWHPGALSLSLCCLSFTTSVWVLLKFEFGIQRTGKSTFYSFIREIVVFNLSCVSHEVIMLSMNA